GLRFFMHHGRAAFVLLGAVVLAVTGAEALYADMGHFGKRPIRLAWFMLVLPALLANYFGQGGLILREPASAVNPFYLLAPSALAAAYGIAVTGTMAITTILFYILARTHWQWSIWRAGALSAFFLIIDLAFFSANMLKIVQGGWVPLAIALGIFILMTTWQRGR